MKKVSLNNQKGFTLIEIAIVLVIIGLLIGGVLKGQSMIQNARGKRLVKDADGMTAAVIAFQDRFQMLPGDENSATIPTAAGDSTTGNHNGVITAAEHAAEDLRLAGLLSGTGIVPPDNTYGGSLDVNNTAVPGSANTFNKIVATAIPAATAQEIDSKYDNGVWNTGTIQGSAAYTAGTIIANFVWVLQ